MDPSEGNGSVEGWQRVSALDDIVELSSEDETDIRRYAATNHDLARVKKERRNPDANMTSNGMIRSMLQNQNTTLPNNVATSTVHTSSDVSTVVQRPQLSPTYTPEFLLYHDRNETESNTLVNDLANNHSINANASTTQGENHMHDVFDENQPGETPQSYFIYGPNNPNEENLHQHGHEYSSFGSHREEYSTYNSHGHDFYNHYQTTQPMGRFAEMR